MKNALKKYGEDAGYKDIILEVANEFSAQGMSDEFWAEGREQRGGRGGGRGGRGRGGRRGGRGREEEVQWYPDECALEVISYELWRKCEKKRTWKPLLQS